eukprot:6075136-Prymnesium_polylepis.1
MYGVAGVDVCVPVLGSCHGSWGGGRQLKQQRCGFFGLWHLGQVAMQARAPFGDPHLARRGGAR